MIRVTIVLPCRNEREHILGVLDCIVNSDYPQDLLEVLVVDGLSTDGTRQLLKDYAARYGNVRIIDNPDRYVSHGMNLGIREARGEIVIRMDCHARYPRDYISTLVWYSDMLNAANVGPCVETSPGGNGRVALAISIVLSSRFGVGNSSFRLKGLSGEYVRVDTVPFGCFRKEIFDRVGLFDEELVRNQDNELNERILQAGGEIFLIPGLKVDYYARKTFRSLWLMLFQYGYYGPVVDRKLGRKTRLRRYVPAAFVGAICLPLALTPWASSALAVSGTALALHSIANLISSFVAAVGARDIRLLAYLLFGFFVAHISYGVGYWVGLWTDFVYRGKRQRGVALRLSR